ncbi:XrtA/PEP-CTERM system-associated ATPase [Geobacter benzoatilyticus]|uniref:AAA family ATPase n=1 Tax=Geobacter benzoatilyticus TaxID=2815309 RepID=A0ABX7Q0U8_9BACT|nr:XrtA/PEP-CTERM system-associated ATPase [Geobacter benzoatilyticus]QSV45028.1 AAA family ATPase [Geobacter benzoatilyticus]
MYEAFFKLAKKPFDLVPNPEFLFLSRSHKKAIAYMDYGIRERAGFILLTGDIGSGKTTLIRDLIRKHRGNVVLSKIFNTCVDSHQLLAMINDDFGLPIEGKDKITLLRELNEFLIDQYATGQQPVIIIDEAQNLTPAILEEIRMLSNLETDDAKLLQIILVGQPELRDHLAGAEMLQFRQRINVNCQLSPLSRVETENYVLHRLEVAGNRNAVTFTPEALDVVYKYSRGIPRLVNIICGFLMLSAFAEQTTVIDGDIACEIVGDLEFENKYWGGMPEPVAAHDSTSAVSHAPAMKGFEELTSLLRDIGTRLESLERESTKSSNDGMNQVLEQVTSLENAFRLHVDETDASLSEVRRVVERIRTINDNPATGSDNEKVRPGLLRKMFGA